MIIVDISVEAFDKTYDFKLDDNVSVSKIIEDICEMLARKEKCAPVKKSGDLILCETANGSILPPGMTLTECGIVSGDRLMLI